MNKEKLPSFQFYSAVSPRYIEPMFVKIQYGRWYSTDQLVNLLKTSGLNVEGIDIVLYNTKAWSLAELGIISKRGGGNFFLLSDLGKYLIDVYSTNHDLFYDLIHFIFYSTYLKSKDVRRGRFWLYANVCSILWNNAPYSVDTSVMTNKVQIEIREAFPEYTPSFSGRAVLGVYPWLQVLSPPFLIKNERHLYSQRRAYCTPQLFHLATDMVYTTIEGVQYGTGLAIGEQQIEAICKVCLLDPEQFWHMADLTQMTVQGFEVRQGQWETSIMLERPPTWITLPDFSQRGQTGYGEQEDEGEE